MISTRETRRWSVNDNNIAEYSEMISFIEVCAYHWVRRRRSGSGRCKKNVRVEEVA